MHHDEREEAEHREEVDGTGRLPAAKDPSIPGEMIHHSWRHRDASQNGQRAEYKNDREIGNLLQSIVSVESVRLRRQMKCRVMRPGVPCLQKHERRRGHQTSPLFGVKEHDDEENTCDDKSVDIDEVPDPRDTDRVPIAGCTGERRNIARIIFRSPDAVAGNLERCQPDPLASRIAVVIEVQAGVVHQNRKAAANQHHYKEKIEEMAVADPERKPVWPCKVAGIYLGDRWNVREAGHSNLNPGSRDCQQNYQAAPYQD